MDDQVPENLRVAEIESDFPDWGVWVSDIGNWWGSLRSALTLDQLQAGCTPFVCADDDVGLVRLLAEREDLMNEAASA